jgi:hypothetical protein
MAGAGRLAKGFAVALLGSSLYAAAPLVIATSPAYAQTIPPAPPANASPAQKQAWARFAVISITSFYFSRVAEGAQFAEAIQNVLLNNPTLAGELTSVIVTFGDRTLGEPGAGGAGEVFGNPSLSKGLAQGLAFAVSTWQAQVAANPGASPVQQAALTAVNTAFTAADVSPGGLFARTFAAASVSTGAGLVSPALVEPNSPEAVLQVTVLPPVKTPSNNVPSPNAPTGAI